MAKTGTTIWEVRTLGNDSAGGGFDPGQTTGAITDAAATSANTASPVLTSASYTFAAGDVGAWVYVAAGTNWTQGWYQIASVNAGAATLSAAIGAALDTVHRPNVAAGCATIASPTSGTVLVDYSQQQSAQATWGDLACASNTTLTSAGGGFTKAMVGNYLQITNGGTNGVVEWYRVTGYTNANTVTIDRTCASGGNMSGATGYLGGALASPAKAAAAMGTVAGQDVWIMGGAYTISSSSSNVANGRVVPGTGGASPSNCQRWMGYGTLRGDKPTGSNRPVLTASGISTTTLWDMGSRQYWVVANLVLDGADLTGIKGFSAAGTTPHGIVYNVRGTRCLNVGIYVDLSLVIECEADDCGTYGIVLAGGSSVGGLALGSYSHDHNSGVTAFYGGGYHATAVRCIADTLSGASSGFLGFLATIDCTTYSAGTNGGINGAANAGPHVVLGCLNEAAGGWGVNFQAASHLNVFMDGAGYSNSSGNVSKANVSTPFFYDGIVAVTAGSMLVDPANGDFDLNDTASQGAIVKDAGWPQSFPSLASTTPKPDVGAVAAASGSGTAPAGGGSSVSLHWW